jgi:hypothetical protein
MKWFMPPTPVPGSNRHTDTQVPRMVVATVGARALTSCPG